MGLDCVIEKLNPDGTFEEVGYFRRHWDLHNSMKREWEKLNKDIINSESKNYNNSFYDMICGFNGLRIDLNIGMIDCIILDLKPMWKSILKNKYIDEFERNTWKNTKKVLNETKKRLKKGERITYYSSY